MNFHGGNVYNYGQKLLDYSSNINPLGVPESFKRALLDNIVEFTKYPDINYIELRKSIAEYLSVEDISFIVPGNGAVELLYRAIQQSGKKRLISIKPTFSEYSRAAKHYQIKYHAIDALKDDYQNVDVEKLIEESDNETAVIICNPNNPTGTLVNKENLIQLAEGLNKKNSMLIVDEAFMEFTLNYLQNSMLDQLSKFENLIVVKAATKFFGMPGIRLGYAVSHNIMLLNKIRESMEPWNINTAAVIAGCTVLKDYDYITSSRAWIAAERDFMYNGLREINGLRVYPSHANFHLIKLTDERYDAWQLKEKLLKNNILIRTPDGFDGLNKQFIRLAVKERTGNEVVLKSINEVLNN